MTCGKCGMMMGWIWLILGVLFLLGDLGVWGFWGINWWTAVFVIFGLKHLACGGCKACKK